jgi:hypothetical protein
MKKAVRRSLEPPHGRYGAGYETAPYFGALTVR